MYIYIYIYIYIIETQIFITSKSSSNLELPSNKLRNLVQFLRGTKMLKALSNKLA